MPWTIFGILILSLDGCGAPTPVPPPRTVKAAPPVEARPNDSSPGHNSSSPVPPNQMSPHEEDVWVIIGGQFTPDHLGPQRHRELLERLVTEPAAYLGALESLLLTTERSPADLSALYPEALLEPLVQRGNRDAALGAMNISRRYQDAKYEAHTTAVPEGDTMENLQSRLQQRIDALRPLTNALFGR